MIRTISVRILVIDDDAAVCRQLAAWLAGAAYDVVTFTRTDDALAHLRAANCHLAMVDLRMPDIDSPAAIERVRESPGRPAVIALAAFPEPRELIEAVRAGARDVLEKPLQAAAVLAAIERQLAEQGVIARSEEQFNERLGSRLRARRNDAGRTLADVAEAAGITANQLSQIELGRSATSTWTLARICAALDVPIGRLLGEL